MILESIKEMKILSERLDAENKSRHRDFHIQRLELPYERRPKPNSTGTSCFISAPVEEMILTRISTDIPMSQHHILYCNALRIPGISESTICCWIMAAEKGGWISFCLGRPDVSLSGLNMMSGSMKMHRKIKRQQFLRTDIF